jgi:hypothetical protein
VGQEVATTFRRIEERQGRRGKKLGQDKAGKTRARTEVENFGFL